MSKEIKPIYQQIVKSYRAGKGITAISRELNIKKTSVHYAVKHYVPEYVPRHFKKREPTLHTCPNCHKQFLSCKAVYCGRSCFAKDNAKNLAIRAARRREIKFAGLPEPYRSLVVAEEQRTWLNIPCGPYLKKLMGDYAAQKGLSTINMLKNLFITAFAADHSPVN